MKELALLEVNARRPRCKRCGRLVFAAFFYSNVFAVKYDGEFFIGFYTSFF